MADGQDCGWITKDSCESSSLKRITSMRSCVEHARSLQGFHTNCIFLMVQDPWYITFFVLLLKSLTNQAWFLAGSVKVYVYEHDPTRGEMALMLQDPLIQDLVWSFQDSCTTKPQLLPVSRRIFTLVPASLHYSPSPSLAIIHISSTSCWRRLSLFSSISFSHSFLWGCTLFSGVILHFVFSSFFFIVFLFCIQLRAVTIRCRIALTATKTRIRWYHLSKRCANSELSTDCAEWLKGLTLPFLGHSCSAFAYHALFHPYPSPLIQLGGKMWEDHPDHCLWDALSPPLDLVRYCPPPVGDEGFHTCTLSSTSSVSSLSISP